MGRSVSEESVREDLRELARNTAEELRTLAKETALNSERWVTHERDCAIRYQDMRRDIKDLAKFVKWLTLGILALVIASMTHLPTQSMIETLLTLIK